MRMTLIVQEVAGIRRDLVLVGTSPHRRGYKDRRISIPEMKSPNVLSKTIMGDSVVEKMLSPVAYHRPKQV